MHVGIDFFAHTEAFVWIWSTWRAGADVALDIRKSLESEGRLKRGSTGKRGSAAMRKGAECTTRTRSGATTSTLGG